MTEDISTPRRRRGLAGAFSLCALATLTLAANHPGGSHGGLANLIQDEADHRVVDAVVHGGFSVTLVALIICFVLFSRMLGSAKISVITGLVCFCVGCGALIASMILDGLVTPAVAVRFVGADDLQPAKTLLILLGTLIGVLMPAGLLLQFVAMISYSAAIVEGHGLRLAVGAYGLAAALLLTAAMVAAPAAMMSHVVLGAVLLQSIWYFALAALLSNRRSWTNELPH